LGHRNSPFTFQKAEFGLCNQLLAMKVESFCQNYKLLKKGFDPMRVQIHLILESLRRKGTIPNHFQAKQKSNGGQGDTICIFHGANDQNITPAIHFRSITIVCPSKP
jgi:hypothetical protein